MKNLGKRPALFKGRKKRRFFIFTTKLQKLPPWNFILPYDYLFSDFAFRIFEIF